MKKLIILILTTLLIACTGEIEKSIDPGEELKGIIERYESYESYDNEAYPLGLYTEERYRKDAEHAAYLLDELNSITVDELSETDKISVELLAFVLQETIDRYDFEAYLNPLLSDSGFHTSLPHQVRNYTSYGGLLGYLKRLKAVPDFVEQHIVLMRKGLNKGISQPRIIFNDFEDTYDTHRVSSFEESFYYTPFLNLPEGISEQKKDSLLVAAREVIERDVIPQFDIIKAFFEEEYFPRTRERVGVHHFPNGEAYYQNRVKYYTTMDITAEEVHQIGLNEVARIRGEMDAIIEDLGFKGSFSDFLNFLRTDPQFYMTTGEALLKEARDISKRIDAKLPEFFITLPRKPYGVAKVPDPIAPKYTGGRYIPAGRNSTRPGYYWVNTYNLKSRPLYILPALTLHEAVPGHHLQMSLNSELGEHIPKFRRNLYLSAYGEGWGLYSEYLGDDMGIYTTPYEQFGKLTYEMWRACRLVVDTGIHAKGWSREEAVDYLGSNTALSLHEVNTEIDRYISWPGQAISYKMGELKIRELRRKAEQEMGDAFDIRQFHEIILEEGTVTLSLLEQRINGYISGLEDGA
jgi:uncharacterized protein (DUF885 family)